MLIEKRNEMTKKKKKKRKKAMKWPKLLLSGLFSENLQNFTRVSCFYPQDEKESRNHCVLILVVRTQKVLMGRMVSEEKELTKQGSKHQISHQLLRKENTVML